MWDNHFMSQPAVNLDKLTPQEQLRLLEQIWERLSRTPEALPLTDPQRQELDRRLDDLEAGNDSGIPWNEVLRRLRGGKE
jgi:putative addiction module component (TIGR02574 family)